MAASVVPAETIGYFRPEMTAGRQQNPFPSLEKAGLIPGEKELVVSVKLVGSSGWSAEGENRRKNCRRNTHRQNRNLKGNLDSSSGSSSGSAAIAVKPIQQYLLFPHPVH